MEKNIEIPQPIALPGTKVKVKNYRMKDNAWEWGKLLMAEYKIVGNPAAYWLYTVLLDRKSKSGKTIRVFVLGEGIALI